MVWADNVAYALNELQRRDMPVLLDLSRGAAALQVARELRSERAATLMFAVVDPRRPDLTTEAVLAGIADVFARPLGARRVANAIDREIGYETRKTGRPSDVFGDALYAHSQPMRDVSALIARAAAMRAGVLIRGEAGTGRTVVGRAIHSAQTGPPGPFVSIDCGEFESDADRRGAFRKAAAAMSASEPFAHGLERVSRYRPAVRGESRHVVSAQHRRGAVAGAGAARARASGIAKRRLSKPANDRARRAADRRRRSIVRHCGERRARPR